MRFKNRGIVLFAAGIVLGMVTIKSIDAQQEKGLGVRVNHVGIAAKHLQETLEFYEKTLGMREGFVMRDANGNPTTYGIQVDKYTFLEISQANANRPAGLNHFAVETSNMSDTVAELRKRGLTVPDPTSAGSGAPRNPSGYSSAIKPVVRRPSRNRPLCMMAVRNCRLLAIPDNSKRSNAAAIASIASNRVAAWVDSLAIMGS